MKKRRKNKVLMRISLVATILGLFYWVWMFYVTQPATDSNTYHRSETITDVELQLAHHRGSDKLYLISADYCYLLDTGWRNREKTSQLAESILSSGESVSITIWEHIPKQVFDIYGKSFKVYQAVDVISGEDTYWDVVVHNDYQRTERISGIIAGIFLSVVVVALHFLRLKIDV